MYEGDWNVHPLAFERLATVLNQPPFLLPVHEVALLPSDPNFFYYSLLYLHGRGPIVFSGQDLSRLRKHIGPGGGMLFADAACGDSAFDAAFRRFVAQLFPKTPLISIPRDDEIFSEKVGADLSDCRYTQAVSVGNGFPQLEGIKINDRSVIIYSQYGIGSALHRDHDLNCKGYIAEDAAKIGENVLSYASQP